MTRQDPSDFTIPDAFWERTDTHAALSARDIGSLFLLVRRWSGASQTGLMMRTQISKSEISAIMSGQRKVTSLDRFEAIADGLNMPDRARSCLGLAPKDGSSPGFYRDEESATDRRHVLQLAGSLVLVPGVKDAIWVEPDRFRRALSGPSPGVETVQAMTRHAQTLAVRVIKGDPSDVLRDAVTGFKESREILEQTKRATLTRDILRAASMYATVVGEVLFNVGFMADALRWYSIAQEAAREAGDVLLHDLALAGSTYIPMYSGDPQGVLDNVASRLAETWVASPAIAWLLAFQAKAYSDLGQHSDFERSINLSRHALEASALESIKPGILSFMPEKLVFYETRGLVSLGEGERAIRSAATALDMYDDEESTEPALVRFESATAMVQVGDMSGACLQAVDAVTDPNTFRGLTVGKRAREFDRLVRKTGSDSGPVHEWREAMHAAIEVRAGGKI